MTETSSACRQTETMTIIYEWDPNKSALNLAKHGVSFDEAEHFEWDRAVVVRDDRAAPEVRWIAFGLLHGRVYRMVWTMRQGRTRVISLHRASDREVARHWKG